MNRKSYETVTGLLERTLATPRTVQVSLRVATVILPYALGVYGLANTTTTAGGPVGVPEALYRALGFFVLGADRVPNGGPGVAVLLHWAALFLCPAALGGAVLESGRFLWSRLASGPSLVKMIRDPFVVVCGYGAHGRSIARLADARGYRVVVVDHESPGDVSRVELARQVSPVIVGDMTQDETLKAARIGAAHAVFFASGDPVQNLKAAFVARNLASENSARTCIVPFIDEDADADVLLEIFPSENDDKIVPFPQFRAAARGLLTAVCEGDTSALERPVTIVGLGRFGRAVLEALSERARRGQKIGHVSVVDSKVARRVAEYRRLHPADAISPESAGEDAGAWVTALESRHLHTQDEALPRDTSLSRANDTQTVFFCIDDDVSNLRYAARVHDSGSAAMVVLRMFSPPRDWQRKGQFYATSLSGLLEAELRGPLDVLHGDGGVERFASAEVFVEQRRRRQARLQARRRAFSQPTSETPQRAAATAPTTRA